MIENRVADLLEAPDAKLVIERVQAILEDGLRLAGLQ